jgi:hypothetical protein
MEGRMHLKLAALCACLILTPFSHSSAEQVSPPTAERDPQALEIIQKTQIAMGLGSLSLASNTVAQATLTTFKNSQITEAEMLLKTGGPGQLRIDLTRNGETDSCVVSGGTGARRLATGETKPINPAMLASTRVDHLPLLYLLPALSDTSVAIGLIGTETLDNSPAWHLELRQEFSPDLDPGGTLADLSKSEVLIDQASGLVKMVRYTLPAVENLRNHQVVELRYSDYRVVNGIAVPNHIEKYIQGKVIATIDIKTFSVNTALSTSEFDVPGGAK